MVIVERERDEGAKGGKKKAVEESVKGLLEMQVQVQGLGRGCRVAKENVGKGQREKDAPRQHGLVYNKKKCVCDRPAAQQPVGFDQRQ